MPEKWPNKPVNDSVNLFIGLTCGINGQACRINDFTSLVSDFAH